MTEAVVRGWARPTASLHRAPVAAPSAGTSACRRATKPRAPAPQSLRAGGGVHCDGEALTVAVAQRRGGVIAERRCHPDRRCDPARRRARGRHRPMTVALGRRQPGCRGCRHGRSPGTDRGRAALSLEADSGTSRREILERAPARIASDPDGQVPHPGVSSCRTRERNDAWSLPIPIVKSTFVREFTRSPVDPLPPGWQTGWCSSS
jgi:hypothetical protein